MNEENDRMYETYDISETVQAVTTRDKLLQRFIFCSMHS